MRKIVVLIAIVFSVNANAQKGSFLVGGDFNFSSDEKTVANSKVDSYDFEFSPVVGYQFNDNMTLGLKATSQFENIPQIYRKLKTLMDVGLGYIKLGQSSTTLSGGESQRVKITRELSKHKSGHVVYLLDEPTTGLHFDDTKKLIKVLNNLVEKGNTVYIIEHNLDIIYKHVDEIVIVVKYKKEKFIEYFWDNYKWVKVSYKEQSNEKGTWAAIRWIDAETDVFIMNWDSIFEKKDLEKLLNFTLWYWVLVKEVDSPEKYWIFELDNSNNIKVSFSLMCVE